MRPVSARTCARSASPPHHQVAMLGRISGSPSSAWAMRGRKASRARISSTPEPSALTSVTEPPRTAPTRPGVPMRESARSSSGSAKAASIRRQSTRTGRRPGDGAHHHPAVGDGQVVAFEQGEAEVAGDVGVLEVGVVERPGREDGDPRRRARPTGPAARRGRCGRSRRAARRGPRRRGRRRPGRWRRGSRARSPSRRAPGCGRRSPTSRRRGRGRSRRRGNAGNARRAAAGRPAGAAIRGCPRPVPPAGGRRPRGGRGRRGRPRPPRAGAPAGSAPRRCGSTPPPRSAPGRGPAARRARSSPRPRTGGRTRRRRAGTGRRARSGWRSPRARAGRSGG